MSIKSKSSSNDENEHLSLAKKIEFEQQKLIANDQRITALEEKRIELQKNNQQKAQKLEELKEEIKKYKVELDPLLKQLRQHFKALREELQQEEDEEDGDDIDIDNMTYEQLLELEQVIGKVSKGVSSSKLESLQKFEYETDPNLQEECTICRDEFEEKQACIKLGCMHFFHEGCLKEWLKREKVCPNCKAQIV